MSAINTQYLQPEFNFIFSIQLSQSNTSLNKTCSMPFQPSTNYQLEIDQLKKQINEIVTNNKINKGIRNFLITFFGLGGAVGLYFLINAKNEIGTLQKETSALRDTITHYQTAIISYEKSSEETFSSFVKIKKDSFTSEVVTKLKDNLKTITADIEKVNVRVDRIDITSIDGSYSSLHNYGDIYSTGENKKNFLTGFRQNANTDFTIWYRTLSITIPPRR